MRGVMPTAVRRACRREEAALGAGRQPAASRARWPRSLLKLMAYKDEYEVGAACTPTAVSCTS